MAEKPTAEKPPESPTTARELDFDDDNDASGASLTNETATSPIPVSKSPKPAVRFNEEATEIPPQKPPRPVDTQAQAQNTLIEAFPDIDSNVIKAVLVASGGKVEPAFNALLSMSDPNFKAEEAAPPPQPPRPQPRSQLEQDELYARQLAEHYQAQGGPGAPGHRAPGQGQGQGQRQQPGGRPGEPEREHSFFDDDLPEIRKNIEQGFKETQQTVTKWISNFTKKLDGEMDEYDRYGNPQYTGRTNPPQQRQNFGASQSDQMYGIRKSAEQQRRSADHTRYDADNRVIGDDFAKLEMKDNDGLPQRSSSRPNANPDLFKPTPVSPPQSGPVDEVDALYRNPSPNNQSAQGKSGGKKWQPLTSVAPHPEPDEHDPFSLGDSDDEEKEQKQKDISPEDTQRLKNAAQQNSEGPTTGKLKPAERSGSVGQKDAAMEALMKEAK